jgi:hypothetical protein
MILHIIRQISHILPVPDVRTGLIARHLVAKLHHPIGLGRGQVVRHRFLVSCIVGSNPTAPAISLHLLDLASAPQRQAL